MAFIIIVSIYSVMILVLAFGFARLADQTDQKSSIDHFISVVIAVRNEAANIPKLLKDAEKIQYSRWEIIIVDDHSTDDLQLPRVNFSLRKISSTAHGKKAAITTGIAAARGEIIVTTDGDCRVDPLWLSEINKTFQTPGVKMVVGGVRIGEERSFFSKLQALEFVSVAVTGAATLGLGFPTMCNGANLAYRKSAFIDVNGFEGNENVSSGDDEFLMNKFDRASIRYLYSQDALVTCSPHAHIGSFVAQRLRWAGKWSVNTSLVTKIFAVVVFSFHVSFIAMLIGAFMGIKLFLYLLLAKAFAEAVLLIPAAIFFKVKWRWTSFLTLQFIYSAYVIAIGLLSQVVLPKWKGRVVETKV